jgi:uncharacterized protein GlcG (DUF336 family)
LPSTSATRASALFQRASSGGIGMSGGTGVQDGIAAKAGVDALK